MNAVTKMPDEDLRTVTTAPADLAPMSEAAAIMQMIVTASRDQSVDLPRIKELWAMKKEIEADAAKKAFTRAMTIMQPKLPVVDQNGRIVINDKAGNMIQSTAYAKWEDMNEVIMPILGEHGFTLTFDGRRAGDQVVVTGILEHQDGHEKRVELSLALDGTGSKNNVQAVGSSISYGKRYTAGLLLNLTSRAKHEDDDDGNAAGGTGFIDADQAETIKDKITATRSNLKSFLELARAPTVEQIRADKYDFLIGKLEAKAMQQGRPQ